MNEIKDGWFIQQERSGIRCSLRVRNVIEKKGSVSVFRTDVCGLLLTDPSGIRYAENDPLFREMKVHCAAFAHEEPRRALVLHGGTGTVAEELLHHRSMERIDVWEEDADVLSLASRHLPHTRRTLADPRIEMFDGPFEALPSGALYDLIYTDFPESVTAIQTWLSRLKKRLRPEGILTVFCASPFHAPDRAVKLFSAMKKLFEHASAAQVFSPVQPGGLALFCTGGDVFDAARPVRRPLRFLARRFQAYSTAAHKAVFAMTPKTFSPHKEEEWEE